VLREVSKLLCLRPGRERLSMFRKRNLKVTRCR
jgi:hypothetical protein